MEQELKCPFCGRNNFKSKSGLTRHIKRCNMNPDRVDVSDDFRRKLSEANKGKKLTDEHKQKISEAGKKRYENPEEHKKSSEAQTIAQNRPETKQKQSEAQKGKPKSEDTKQKMSETANRPEVQQKRYNTMKQNNSFNTSKIETELKEYLISHNINFETQYKSEQYPFRCDFYFPNKDLYVEIQGSWTHGGKPYIETDQDCIEQLEYWKSKQLELWKSKKSKYYDNAIDTWTIRDVKKRETAKINNLNWIEIFSRDLDECVDIIQKHIK